MIEHYDFDPFEGRRGKSFFSQKELEEFERYIHVKTQHNFSDFNDCEKVKPMMRLWQIKYVVEGEQKFIGSATIAAESPKKAEVIFINESVFNGFKEYLRITEIQEIMIPMSPAMMAENYTGVIDKNFLQKYPFETKRHAHSHYFELKEEIAELRNYIDQLDEKKDGGNIEKIVKSQCRDVTPRGIDSVIFKEQKEK